MRSPRLSMAADMAAMRSSCTSAGSAEANVRPSDVTTAAAMMSGAAACRSRRRLAISAERDSAIAIGSLPLNTGWRILKERMNHTGTLIRPQQILDVVLVGELGGFDAIRNPQFAQDGAHVMAYRLFREIERFADLGIGFAFGHQGEDFQLSFSQVFEGTVVLRPLILSHAVDQFLRNLWIQDRFSSAGGFQRVDQLLVTNLLEHITRGAC